MNPWTRQPVLVAGIAGATAIVLAVLALIWHVTDQDNQMREQIIELCGDEAIEVRQDCIDTWHAEFFE